MTAQWLVAVAAALEPAGEAERLAAAQAARLEQVGWRRVARRAADAAATPPVQAANTGGTGGATGGTGGNAAGAGGGGGRGGNTAGAGGGGAGGNTAGAGGGGAGGNTAGAGGSGGAGGNTAGAGGGGAGGNTAGAGGGGAGGNTAGAGGGGAGGNTAGAGGGGAGGGNTAGTGGATGRRLEIQSLMVFGNCQPSVPADPIMVRWTSAVTGGTSSSATLVSAVLTLTGFRTITQSLTVTPTAIPLTNGAGSAAQQKTAGDPAPGNVCGEVCSSNARLDVTLSDGGVQFTATATGTYNCAF